MATCNFWFEPKGKYTEGSLCGRPATHTDSLGNHYCDEHIDVVETPEEKK